MRDSRASCGAGEATSTPFYSKIWSTVIFLHSLFPSSCSKFNYCCTGLFHKGLAKTLSTEDWRQNLWLAICVKSTFVNISLNEIHVTPYLSAYSLNTGRKYMYGMQNDGSLQRALTWSDSVIKYLEMPASRNQSIVVCLFVCFLSRQKGQGR